jgi:hypothetical protein
MLVRSITAKFTEADFETLQFVAEREGKCVSEWSRESLLRLLKQPSLAASLQTLLAEVAATQSITISLLFAFARDGKLLETKVREILDRARKDKFAQAAELLRQASTAATAGDSPVFGAHESKTRSRS